MQKHSLAEVMAQNSNKILKQLGINLLLQFQSPANAESAMYCIYAIVAKYTP